MKKNYLILVFFFGSVWGLLEATIGGALHIARIPYTGAIMSSIGFALLYAVLRAGARPSHLFVVSLVAASFKFLDPLLFGIAFFDKTVVNPAIAIASQGLMFALVFRRNAISAGIFAKTTRMLFVSALSMAAFNAVSLGLLGWPTNQTQHIANAILIQLPLSALAAALLSIGIDRLARLDIPAPAPRWQAATAAICAILALAAKAVMK